MSGERRKITVYLHPDDAVADKAALAALDAMPQRMRGDFYRNALISAVALSQVDARLPAVIAMLFDGDLSARKLVDTIEMITGIPLHQTGLDPNNTYPMDECHIRSDPDAEENCIRSKAKNLF
jgi:Plasmid stability protein